MDASIANDGVLSFNTQPPEGGCHLNQRDPLPCEIVSTHSRPKAAADWRRQIKLANSVSTHSRPKAAAHKGTISAIRRVMFQHTAARRRLRGEFD